MYRAAWTALLWTSQAAHNVAPIEGLVGDDVLNASHLRREAKPAQRHNKRIVWLSALSVHPACSDAEKYLDQYEIALISWNQTKNHDFDPHFILHLPENQSEAPLKDMLKERFKRIESLGAKLIYHRLTFFNRMVSKLANDIEEEIPDPECLAGTFMRLEIPRIVKDNEILKRHDHNYVLYTDTDIVWWRKVTMNEFMSSIPSKKFSVAYSGQLNKDEGAINTGVILMHLPNFQRDMQRMLDWMFREYIMSTAWDQGVLNKYYDENPGRRIWTVKWNYRMFWNGREPVAIVHYWGIKPSKGIDCWIRKRSMVECPEIDQGLIPNDLQSEYERVALHLAKQEDPKLFFMKEVMIKYGKYEKIQKNLP